ncbi:unnamed protein product [Urochloa humidicola]
MNSISKHEVTKKLASLLTETCKKNSVVLPLTVTTHKRPWDTEESTNITFTGDPSSQNPFMKVAQSLAEMNDIIDFHGYEVPTGQRKEIRDYRTKTAWTDYPD